MPKWLQWLRGEADTRYPRSLTLIDRTPVLPVEPPAGVGGALWASWQARWQEF